MIDNSDIILEKVIALKEESGMSFDEISIKSKVPLTSVKRYFNGETKSPGFLQLSSVIVSLGGSVDDVLGLTKQPQKPTNNEFTQLLQSDLRYERKLKERWQILFLILCVIDITILVIDLLNPAIGYVRYTRQVASSGALPTVMLLFKCFQSIKKYPL